MENFRGICTSCGIAHSDPNHQCNADKARLVEIEREWGPRHLREWMVANNIATEVVKNGKTIADIETEVAAIRARR